MTATDPRRANPDHIPPETAKTIAGQLARWRRRPADPQIAATILEQLGGMARLAIMTGAKNFVDVGNGLMFSIACISSKTNRVEIKLNAADTYDVRMLNISIRRDPADMVQTISEAEGVDCDQLRGVIERGTGMVLSL